MSSERTGVKENGATVDDGFVKVHQNGGPVESIAVPTTTDSESDSDNIPDSGPTVNTSTDLAASHSTSEDNNAIQSVTEERGTDPCAGKMEPEGATHGLGNAAMSTPRDAKPQVKVQGALPFDLPIMESTGSFSEEEPDSSEKAIEESVRKEAKEPSVKPHSEANGATNQDRNLDGGNGVEERPVENGEPGTEESIAREEIASVKTNREGNANANANADADADASANDHSGLPKAEGEINGDELNEEISSSVDAPPGGVGEAVKQRDSLPMSGDQAVTETTKEVITDVMDSAVDAPVGVHVDTGNGRVEDEEKKTEDRDLIADAAAEQAAKSTETPRKEEASEHTATEEASGKVVRTESNAEKVERDAFLASQQAAAELAASEPSEHATEDPDTNSNRPMDASGRLSIDPAKQMRRASLQDPVGDHGEEVVKEKPPLANGETGGLQRNEKDSSPQETSRPLATPAGIMDKEASDAAIKAAMEPASEDSAAAQPQVPLDLLSIRDKEGFGLLARGESFKGYKEKDDTQQSFRVLPSEQTSQPAHVPPETIVAREGGESSFASPSPQVSRLGAELNGSRHRADNDHLNGVIDDNSWRPSQISYPPSPQVQAPQAIPLNNGGYMVMPQHQMPQHQIPQHQMPQHQIPPHQIPQHPAQPPHAFLGPAPAMLHHQSSFHSHPHQPQLVNRSSYGFQPVPQAVPAMAPMPSPGGKRKIKLKLQEEILSRPAAHNRRGSFFFGARSTRKLMARPEPVLETEQFNEVDRGTITVSWFEGTSSLELNEHVLRSVSRKLKLNSEHTLEDVRILDTKVEPPEEIVLSPYIPSGSEFVLRYKLKQASGRASPTFYGPPDSPSAAPSPFPSSANLGGLDSSQLAVLRKQLDAVQGGERRTPKYQRGKGRGQVSALKPTGESAREYKKKDSKEIRSESESDGSDGDNDSDANLLKPESSVDARLRQITELLLLDKQKQQQHRYPKVEKRQVIFVLANYFVLFVAFLAVLAEINARAPDWLSWVEKQLENVQNCSADQDSLFQCVSNGEFAGLFATLILWISRSAATKQIFLLGFDSPQKLWTVFYESLVGAFCWGVSYMFIRRGMNPDTRPQFLQKYWKDCLYGSLAGFNATFLKQVLKNLIPQEAVEEAFNDRQLKILSWLPSFA